MSSRPGWPRGYGLHRLEETDSTNAEAARLAEQGVTGPVWITAQRQTAGRGRRGRAWASPEGALAATLLLTPSELPAKAALRSFVAALALDDAFRAMGVRAEAIALKWPNDVLIHDSKAAGILLESSGHGGVLHHLAIGFGVNLTAAPDGPEMEPGAVPPISLAQATGRPVARDDMLTALAAAYALWEETFLVRGFAPIRAAWLSRAARIGTRITARTPTRSFTGIFETVDELGNLILAESGSRRSIPAADVFF